MADTALVPTEEPPLSNNEVEARTAELVKSSWAALNTFPSAEAGKEKVCSLAHHRQQGQGAGSSFPCPHHHMADVGCVANYSTLTHSRLPLPRLCQQGHMYCAAQVRNRARFPECCRWQGGGGSAPRSEIQFTVSEDSKHFVGIPRISELAGIKFLLKQPPC